MLININNIPAEGLVLNIHEEDFPLDLEGDGLSLDGAVTGTVRVKMVEDVLTTSGQIAATLKSTCNRCLKPVSAPLKAEFATDYRPLSEMGKDAGFGHEHELLGDDLDISFYSGEEIDLSDIIRDQIILAVPMRQLCRDDCKGLCPHCGQDLNEGDCGCVADVTDPRLAKLKELLRKQ